ncbi:ribonuclease R [bacterium]|nr:ribonuclease R [bacterium]
MKEKDAIEKPLQAYLNARPGQSFKSRELARKLGVHTRDYRNFKMTLRALVEADAIGRYKGGRFGSKRAMKTAEGVLHIKTQGYGFVLREDGGEKVFVSESRMAGAMHRDRVEVEIWSQEPGKSPEGRVVKILSRAAQRIVGTFHEGRKVHYVTPDEIKTARDIAIEEELRNGARDGQKVVVEVVRTDDRRPTEGRVAEVLGFPDEKGVDVLSVLVSHNLPSRFPSAVEREVNAIPAAIPESEIGRRLDLRDQFIFTIDPDDAKDFDDAVSLEKLPNGRWQLGVHIADVSHFVTPGSAVDREALSRATSIYLVDRVIPMLPERLSGELCSLRPLEDRLTYSVLLEVSDSGEVFDYRIAETVIHSKHRLTYTQAQALIDGAKRKPAPMAVPGASPQLARKLRDMRDLSQILLRKWEVDGMIDFDLPEAEIRLDEKGRPSDVRIKERLESHRLIEAFMLLANRTVAEHVGRLRLRLHEKLPFVYRVHEKPSTEKLADFSRFVAALGVPFKAGKSVTPKQFQRYLDGIQESKHKVVIEDVALRTMMKAQYDTSNVGHFGLAFKQYTHFTSPIRRYPDLAVHRLLKAYGAPEGPGRPVMAASLSDICRQSTEREVLAQQAERESIRVKQAEFMERHIGDEFEGVVSGVTGFGVFVEIPEFLIEGLVHISDLSDDYWVHDAAHFRLTGRNSGQVVRLGDSMKVRVSRVLKSQRKIDFVPVAELKPKPRTNLKPKPRPNPPAGRGKRR